jgi:predicted amidophosphoribosyltransferase
MGIFVIKFSSVENFGWDNAYGYYCGKTRTKAKEVYPISVHDKNFQEVKWYTSKKIAEKAAEKIGNKCAYVVAWRVEEL